MTRKPKPPRERAARALCSYFDIPENIARDKKPMWTQYLDMADAALQAALSPEEWEKIKAEGPEV
ncbi:hypothetical protein DEM27_10560 [Metarhizobium album]|uniref:Uncharacterized protein n=1 Tax=Metarhizobium album TaxID=2182425 RepID=A0A2U2DU02_9HYPH|nr:hypothetical protein [Rhizobium album]PWE56795.1 hypothetical protein DEM27_10560 [Rhizobium album]